MVGLALKFVWARVRNEGVRERGVKKERERGRESEREGEREREREEENEGVDNNFTR